MQSEPLAIDLFCGHCEIPLGNCRPDKKFCSTKCAQRVRYGRAKFPFDRKCKVCETEFVCSNRHDANRRYCSRTCSKRAYTKGIGVWNRLHPDRLIVHRTTRVKKNPDVWKEQARSERRRILELLGGACVVCGVSNPHWLHVDYIPTCRGEPFRHPRTLKFTRENLALFRILCANHHYELTLTGKIEGTEIVQ